MAIDGFSVAACPDVRDRPAFWDSIDRTTVCWCAGYANAGAGIGQARSIFPPFLATCNLFYCWQEIYWSPRAPNVPSRTGVHVCKLGNVAAARRRFQTEYYRCYCQRSPPHTWTWLRWALHKRRVTWTSSLWARLNTTTTVMKKMCNLRDGECAGPAPQGVRAKANEQQSRDPKPIPSIQHAVILNIILKALTAEIKAYLWAAPPWPSTIAG